MKITPYLLTVAALASVSINLPQSTAQESPAPTATPNTEPATTTELAPAVKGLSIGMHFSQVAPWFSEKLKDTNVGYEVLPQGEGKAFLMARSDFLRHLQDGSKGHKVSASDREYQLRLYHEENPSFVLADADGKVTAIILRPKLVNYLFRASDLSTDEFTRTFAEAYKLGDLTVDDNMTSRTCTTAKGVKITIDSDKTVSLTKVAAPADVKGAFD